MHDNALDRSRLLPLQHRRWRALSVLSVAALLLHAAALSGVDWFWSNVEAPLLPAERLEVRLVDTPAQALAAPAPTTFDAEPPVTPMQAQSQPQPQPHSQPRSQAPTPTPTSTLPRTRAHATGQPAAAPLAEVGPSGSAATARVPALALQPPPVLMLASVEAAVDSAPALPLQLASNGTTPPAAAEATLAVDEETIPQYRTQLPPPMTLRYEMQRGALRGTGDLVWRPNGDQYELRLDARVSGLAVLTQRSSGGFDAAGLAPQRFTDRRLGRGTTAANFQRDADKITYSGAPGEFALRPGAQDRLSWMLQLAAIVAAEPAVVRPGAKVVMYVTGSHGDAGLWSFRCVGPEAVSTRAGSVDAVKFVREPREPYDTTVEVWLAPQQHALPVRATQKSGPNDEGYELRLIEAIAGA